MKKLHVSTSLDITGFVGKTLTITELSNAETVKLLNESNKCNTPEDGVDCLVIRPDKNVLVEVNLIIN